MPPEKAKRKRRSTTQIEMEAVQTIVEALRPLSGAQRERIVMMTRIMLGQPEIEIGKVQQVQLGLGALEKENHG